MSDQSPDPPRRKRPRSKSGKDTEQTKLREQRIEEVRLLMCYNYSDGDIKRMLSSKWGTARRTVEKYLCRARARQRELLDRGSKEARADSLDFWRRKLQEAQQRASNGKRDLESAAASIKQAEAVLDREDARQEEKEIAAIRLKSAVQRQETARRLIWAAETQVREDQQVIDKLLGNHAPLKVARTDSEGADIPVAPPEPVDPDAELSEMLVKLRERASSPGVN